MELLGKQPKVSPTECLTIDLPISSRPNTQDVQNSTNIMNMGDGEAHKGLFARNLKYISLVLLTLQNALLILVMRYTRIPNESRGGLYISTTAVILSEMLKCSSCLVIIFIMEGCSLRMWVKHLNENIFQQPLDCLKIAVPSIVYTVQNNLLYVAVSNLEAATFQVSYQLKILTTALFSVFMLNKVLTKMQWVSLVCLFVGVSIVQLQPASSSVAKDSSGQNQFLGMGAVLISCFLSGFAGVYFEKVLKGTTQTIWLRNVQLGFLGMIIGYITMMINDGPAVREKGFFYGYDWVVWFVICLQSIGGLMVAVVVKYADNILKGFATSAAIILSCVASVYFFDFHISLQFIVGAGIVISSVYMYSKFVAPPVPASVTSNKSLLA